MPPTPHAILAALVCGWIERIPAGTRQNDGLETGLWGGLGEGPRPRDEERDAVTRRSQCLETRLPCIFGEHPSPIFKTLCCDDSMPPATEGRP